MNGAHGSQSDPTRLRRGVSAALSQGAFAYPAYRRYWIATVARVFGLQFNFIGLPWLVAVELDRSPVWVGAAGIASALPPITLSVPAGLLADRFDNRKLLMWSQGLTTLVYLVAGLAVVTGAVQLWMVFAWAVTIGGLSAIANPAQSAILPRLIEMRSIPSAVALNSAIWNSMRIVGPAAAGLLIALVGTGQAFFATAAGYGASTALIAGIRLRPGPARAGGHQGGLLTGLAYIGTHPLFLATIGLSFFTSIFGASYQALLAFFARDILDAGSSGFGLMEAAAGVGALLGTLSIAKIGASERRGPIMLGGAGIFGLLICAFAASRTLPLSMTLLFAAGFASSVYLNIGMTTLQLLVPDEMRGRVMGVWSMTWFLSSFGGAVSGGMAEFVGVAWAVALGGLAVAGFAALLYLVSSELRQLKRVQPAAAAGAPAG